MNAWFEKILVFVLEQFFFPHFTMILKCALFLPDPICMMSSIKSSCNSRCRMFDSNRVDLCVKNEFGLYFIEVMVVTFSCLNLQLILSIWVHLQVFALNHHLSFSFVSTIVSTPEICFVIGTMEEFTRKAKQIVRFIYLFFCFHRVEYKQLGKLRGILPNVPFVGLTATATEKYAFSTFVQGCKLILFFWSFYGLFCGGHSFYVTYRCCTFWVKTSSSYLRNRYVKLQIDYNDNFL